MKSPNPKENKNTGGQKFQNRQPGEKRSRLKSDSPKSSNRPTKTEEPRSSKATNPRKFNSGNLEERKSYGQRTVKTDRFSDSNQRTPFNRERSTRPSREDNGFRKERTERSDSKSSYRSTDRKSIGGNNEGFKRKSENRGGEYNQKSEGFSGKRGFSSENRGSESRSSKYSGRNTSYSSRPSRREEGFSSKSANQRDTSDSPRNSFEKEGRNTRFNKGTSAPPSRGFPKSSKYNSNQSASEDNSFKRGRSTKKKDNFQETPKSYKGSRKTYGKVQQQQEQSLLAGEDLVRLNRFIANSGICSRREADELISQGLVKVNGQIVTELGTKVKPTDVVKVEDRKVTPEKPIYILLNKPKGYITSTSDPEGRQTVLDLIDLPGKERIYPVGRLDRNTTGVLLLTNDGELSQKLMHPSFEIKKIYRATLDKRPTKEHMLAWVEGVELEDGWMTFEQIGWVEEGEENVLGVEIKSGRNRIVRRMFEHFGYDVVSLDRVMLGEFDKLKLGRSKWRFLSEKEMRYIERIKRMQ